MDSDTAIWPDALPLPKESARQSVSAHNWRTLMESERVRSRRTLPEPVKLLEVAWAFTEDQFNAFQTFFNDELENGSLSFVIEIFGEEQEMAFLDSRYAFSRSDNLFLVSATLEYAPSVLVPTIDLELTSTAPASLLLGGEYSYVFTTTNLGNTVAEPATLVVVLDPDLDFVSATGGVVPDSDGTLTFSLGAILPGAPVSIAVTFEANTLADVTTTGSVSTTSTETDDFNNDVTINQTAGLTDWALRVIANGGAQPSLATIEAMEDARLALVAAGLDTKMHSLCIFVPDSLIAATTPLIVGIGADPWVNNNFVTGDLTVEGLKGNATDKYLDTGVIGNSGNAFDATTGNCGLSLVVTEQDGNATNRWEIGHRDSGRRTLLLGASDTVNSVNGRTAFFCRDSDTLPDIAFTTDWDRCGFVSGNNVAGTSSVYVKSPLIAHALIATATVVPNPSVSATETLFAFALNDAATPTAYSGKRISVIAVHDGLTSGEAESLADILITLRQALGGGDGNEVQNWAVKVAANGGAAPSANTITRLKTFYSGLDSNALLPKMVTVMPLVPDNLVAARIPLVWRAGSSIWSNVNFLSGDLGVNGLTGNGTTKSLGTGIIPHQIVWPAFTDTSAGQTCVVSSNAGGAADCVIGSGESATNSQFSLFPNAGTASNASFRCWRFDGNDNVVGAKPSPGATWAGYLSGNRTAINAIALYAASNTNAHATLASIAANKAGNKNNFNTHAMSAVALNGIGTISNWFDGTVSFLAVHAGLTSGESSTFNGLIKALRDGLGGGYP